MPKTQLKVVYPNHSFDREVEIKPEGQAFGIGEEVYIRPMIESSMSHFTGDVITTVKHSYNQAYGDGGASSSYSTEIAAWYDEEQLMSTNGRTIEECRKACLEYFGVSYEELLKIHQAERDAFSKWLFQGVDSE